MSDKYLNFQAFAGLIPDFSFDGVCAETYWCRIAGCEKQFNQMEHKHSFYELHLCIDGHSKIAQDEDVYTISSGEFLLVPVYKNHTLLEQSEDFAKLVWGFRITSQDVEKREQIDKLLSSAQGVYTSSAVMNSCLTTLLCVTESLTKDRISVFKSALASLFFELCTLISGESCATAVGQIRYKEHSEQLVRQIEIFVRDNIKHPLTVADIAAEFSLSSRQISRLFLKYNGKSVATFLKEERFVYAERLMRDMEYTLEDVALSVGYTDPFTFSKAFKRYYGISPGAFRKSMNLK